MSGTTNYTMSSTLGSGSSSALGNAIPKEQRLREIGAAVNAITSDTKVEALDEILKKSDESKLEPLEKLSVYIDLINKVIRSNLSLTAALTQRIEAKFVEFTQEFASLEKIDGEILYKFEKQIERISGISNENEWLQQFAKKLSAFKNTTIQQIQKQLATSYEKHLKTLAESKLIEAKANVFFLTQKGLTAYDHIFYKKYDELDENTKELYALINLDLTVLNSILYSRKSLFTLSVSIRVSVSHEPYSLQSYIAKIERERENEEEYRKVADEYLKKFSLPKYLPRSYALEKLSESFWVLNLYHRRSNLEKLQNYASKIVKNYASGFASYSR